MIVLNETYANTDLNKLSREEYYKIRSSLREEFHAWLNPIFGNLVKHDKSQNLVGHKHGLSFMFEIDGAHLVSVKVVRQKLETADRKSVV